MAFAYTGEAEIDGIKYYIVTKGNDASVIGCKSEITNLIIPETIEYDGVICNVTAIQNRAFWGNYKLTSVSLPNSIVKIDHFAFADCEKLSSITIPKSVTYLGQGVFYRCTNLSTVNIPSITQWLNIINYQDTFTDPYQLQIDGVTQSELSLPTGISEIKIGTFQNCISIERIHFAGEINKIGASAFKGCKNIKEIIMSENVSYIGQNAFEGCEKLENLQLSSNIETIEVSAFSGCSNLRMLRIPEGVKNLYAYSFAYCTNLTKVYLPSSLKTIRERVFRSCTEITDIYAYSITPPDLSFYAFDNSDMKYITLHVPLESIDSYKEALPWNYFKSIVTLTNEDAGINHQAISTENGEVIYNTIDGRKIESTRKGIYIIRNNSGQTRKIIITR